MNKNFPLTENELKEEIASAIENNKDNLSDGDYTMDELWELRNKQLEEAKKRNDLRQIKNLTWHINEDKPSIKIPLTKEILWVHYCFR